MTPKSDAAASVRGALRKAQEKIEAGQLPIQLIAQARATAEAGESEKFVSTLSSIFDSPEAFEKLQPQDFNELAQFARKLDLEDVGAEILQLGTDLHPDATDLHWNFLRFMGTSSMRSLRDRCRVILEERLGIKRDGSNVKVDKAALRDSPKEFGLLMDIFAHDESPETAVTVAKAAAALADDEPVILRNYGRSLHLAGRSEEAAEVLREATHLPRATDMEASFLATVLASTKDHRGALEADLLACIRDPDDATNFIRTCIALTLAENDKSLEPSAKEALFHSAVVSRMIEDALSCRLLTAEDRRLAKVLADGFEVAPNPLSIDTRVKELIETEANGSVPLGERKADAERWHRVVVTELTAPPSD